MYVCFKQTCIIKYPPVSHSVPYLPPPPPRTVLRAVPVRNGVFLALLRHGAVFRHLKVVHFGLKGYSSPCSTARRTRRFEVPPCRTPCRTCTASGLVLDPIVPYSVPWNTTRCGPPALKQTFTGVPPLLALQRGFEAHLWSSQRLPSTLCNRFDRQATTHRRRRLVDCSRACVGAVHYLLVVHHVDRFGRYARRGSVVPGCELAFGCSTVPFSVPSWSRFFTA